MKSGYLASRTDTLRFSSTLAPAARAGTIISELHHFHPGAVWWRKTLRYTAFVCFDVITSL